MPAAKPRKGRKHPKVHRATRERRSRVSALVVGAMPEDEIAKELGIARSTLRKHYSKELLTGRDVANANVAAVAYSMAISGLHPEMTRFWLERRAGWHRTERFEVVDDTFIEMAREYGIDEKTAIEEAHRLANDFANRRGLPSPSSG